VMNENWRLILALFLTMFVMLTWNYFYTPDQEEITRNKTGTTAEKEVKQSRQSQASKDKGQTSKAPDDKIETSEVSKNGELQDKPRAKGDTPTFVSKGEEKIKVETPLYKAVFNSQGGIVEHFWLKNYSETVKNDEPIDLITEKSLKKAPLGLIWDYKATWKNAEWTVEGRDLRLGKNERDNIVFRGKLDGVTIVRKMTFQGDSYEIQEQTKFLNPTENRVTSPVAYSVASANLVSNERRFNTTEVSYLLDQSVEQYSDKETLGTGVKTDKPVKWAGIESTYFILATIPTHENMYFKGTFDDKIYRAALQKNVSIKPDSSEELASSYYMGPKDKKYLDKAPNELILSLNYGYLDIIAKPLMAVLKYFYGFVGNYGVAIILLTIVIKIIFWPLSQKSYKSMEQMKKLQPMMQKIKEQYKDDRQKMNQELMNLYKTYKVNPAGGCLPMLLQIPVFIGLYEALLGSIELRHAAFISHFPFTNVVWLADLAAKDPYYITPVLMGLSMFLQQKMSPTAGDPTQAKIMMIMPVFLTFIFLNFPAGLVVYFITNNLLSMFQQWLMLRKA